MHKIYRNTKKKPFFSNDYTLIVVPDCTKPVKAIKVPVRLVVSMIVFSLCALLGMILASIDYLNMKANVDELDMLRSINKFQEEKLDNIETETREFKMWMAEIDQLENRVNKILSESKAPK